MEGMWSLLLSVGATNGEESLVGDEDESEILPWLKHARKTSNDLFLMLLKANYECVSYCSQPVISTTDDNASFYFRFKG